MRVAFQIFRGSLTTWHDLFGAAAEFASRLDPDRLISISHSSDHSDGVVTVWFWESWPPPGPLDTR